MSNQPPLLDETYWNNLYKENETRWDMQQVSPPLKAYADQLKNKELRILIPGCGNSYEAEYLLQQGFNNITVIDIAALPVEGLKEKLKAYPYVKILQGDFFEHSGEYDLILEQTFFCALNPAMRTNYVKKIHQLLAPGGKLAGVLFASEFENEGPPFGGTKEEYETIFNPYFTLHTLSPCYNSYSKRMGNEFFICFIKK
mgnify:CR=1 FL=1